MRLIVLGATGSLGRQVLRQALGAGHDVSVLVRDPSRLPAEARERVAIHTVDLSVALPSDVVSGHDALINCAGHVTEGERFVRLVDRVVASVESLPAGERPVCWFLAGAALLDLDASGRRGVDLPEVRSTYWPHRSNFERLERCSIDWRLLCPGPMVDQPPLGLERLRISLDHLPVEVPAVGSCASRLSRSAGVRFSDSSNDRALRRRGGGDAREPRSQQRDGATSRRARAAGGYARSQAIRDCEISRGEQVARTMR